jgi:hypothetical protein
VRALAPAGFEVPDFSAMRNQIHRYFFVHGGVFAVMDFHDPYMGYTLADGCNGIFFFSRSDGRMLRHMAVEDMTSPESCFMQSRPTQLWLMAGGKVAWFHSRVDIRSSLGVNLAARSEVMDPALWMAGRGDAAGAMQFLTSLFCRREIEDVINSCSNSHRRTLLHFAAAEGQLDACRAFLEVGASCTMEDNGFMTPIALAMRKLHYEVVILLLEQRGEMYVEEFSKIWWEFCRLSHVLLPRHEDAVRAQCREIIPGIMRMLLFTSMPMRPNFILNVHLQRALESPAILASADAVELVIRTGGEPFRDMCQKSMDIYKQIFRCLYPTHTHQVESFETVKMLFNELGFDVNRNLCKYERADYPLVHAVRSGDLALVRFMIEELGADILVRGKTSMEDIRTVAFNRVISANQQWRDESIRIRDYVTSVFEQQGLIGAYWMNNTMVRLTARNSWETPHD